MSEMTFEIEDVISLKENGYLVTVTGVIHDDERLFVTGRAGYEFEIPFNQVQEQWTKVNLDN